MQPSRKQRREQARAQRQEAERRAAAEAARRRRLIQFGGLIGLAAVIVVVAIIVSSGGAKGPTKKGNEQVAGQSLAAEEFNGIQQSGDTLGDPNAKHTLIEYGDINCPACKEYSDSLMPQVVDKYVRSGQLKIQFKPFGFIQPWTYKGARYAWAAAEQNKMWEFSKLWYYNQKDETVDYDNDAFATQMAKGVPGLNVKKLLADANSKKVADEVKQTQQEFQQHSFTATPSFLAGPSGGKLTTLDPGATPSSFLDNVGKMIDGKSTSGT